MANEDILKKIRALRAKVSNAASTEAEVEAAAKLVSKLMMQHDVTEDLLKEGNTASGVHARGQEMKNDIDRVMMECWHGVQSLTETKCYQDSGALNFIGLPHDVEMALYLVELIQMSAKRGWLAHAAKLIDQDGATRTKKFRVSYYVGFGERMARMLDELDKERQNARTEATGTALVVRKNEVIKGKMKEMGLSLRKRRARATGAINDDARKAGQAAASKVNLNRPFGGNSAAGSIK